MNNSSSSTAANLSQQANLGMEEMSKLLPVAIVIVFTNGLVFVLFYKRKGLRNLSNILLLGLAVCDFLTGAVNIPYFIVFSFGVVPWTSPMFKDFAFWMFILQTLMAISAAYHILIITAEKYLAIIQPLKHYLVTKKAVFKVLAGIWMVSTFIAMIPFAWRKAKSPLYLVIYSATCLVIVFLVPYVFMLYAYTVMFKAVSERTMPSRYRDRSRIKKKNKTDRKCILVFGTMAVIYLCCWLPYFTIMLIYNIKAYIKSSDSTAVDKASEPIAITRYITSAINPLLYTFFKRDFWTALRSVLGLKKPLLSDSRTSTTSDSSLPYSLFKRRWRNPESARSTDITQGTRLSVTRDGLCTGSEEIEGLVDNNMDVVSSV